MSSGAGMNGRPRLLDLFCGAGGCSMGYHRAGFDVVGVDIEPHPVPGAPMRKDLVLCGTMFGLRSKHGQLIRHRWFEFGQDSFALVPPCNHQGPTVSVFGHGGHVYHGVDDWREVMGIDWMKRDDLAQAIPPAYTEFVGQQLLTQLEGRVAA